MRDERLRVEKSVWSLKSELEALSTRRDDAARRDRRREREEGALAARREALAAAAASEEERLGLAKTAKELLEAEVRIGVDPLCVPPIDNATRVLETYPAGIF